MAVGFLNEKNLQDGYLLVINGVMGPPGLPPCKWVSLGITPTNGGMGQYFVYHAVFQLGKTHETHALKVYEAHFSSVCDDNLDATGLRSFCFILVMEEGDVGNSLRNIHLFSYLTLQLLCSHMMQMYCKIDRFIVYT